MVIREKLSRRHRMMAAGASGSDVSRMLSRSGSMGAGVSVRPSGVSVRPSGSPNLSPRTSMAPVGSMMSVANEMAPADISAYEFKAAAKARGSVQFAEEVEEVPRDGATSRGEAPAVASPPRSYWQQQADGLQEIFFSPMALLLIFVPLGQFVAFAEWNALWVFGCNFMAIIPLASILGNATEAISGHTGQLLGGLLNATFGNAVEMIMCVQAVKAGLIRVVQGNLLGSILSNLLLVLGMAICASGVLRKSQVFNAHGAAANMTCQAVASISMCLPTMFRAVPDAKEEDVLLISRVCSLFLIGVYGLFLFFQMKTHPDLFADVEEEEVDAAGLSLSVSVLLLLLCTLVVAACSEALVSSIEGVSEDYGLPKAFIGVILLPIVGNAAEHATAVTCAYKGMMDLALGVAVGSSTQIALFVVPCSVMFGWVFDQPMTLGFRKFDTACQMLSVALVSQVLQHGNTNWLHGAMLMTTYFLIASITWFIPE